MVVQLLDRVEGDAGPLPKRIRARSVVTPSSELAGVTGPLRHRVRWSAGGVRRGEELEALTLFLTHQGRGRAKCCGRRPSFLERFNPRNRFYTTVDPVPDFQQRPDRYAETLASRRYSGFSIVSPDSRAEKLGNRVGCPPTSAREPNKFDDHQHTRGSSSTYLPRTMIGSRGKHEQIECRAVTGFPAVSENYRTTGGHSIWKLQGHF